MPGPPTGIHVKFTHAEDRSHPAHLLLRKLAALKSGNL